jgi:hypothetical protein
MATSIFEPEIRSLMPFESWRSLALALPLVFVIGAPVILLTRLILYLTQSNLDYVIPSISRTAVYAPGSHIFAVGMTAVAICIAVSWWVCRRVGKERILCLAPERFQYGLIGLNAAASYLGITAGLMLVLLVAISVEDDSHLHVVLGFLFFSFQVAAFAADTICYAFLRRCSDLNEARKLSLSVMTRLRLSLAVMAASCLFWYMYISKSSGLFGSEFLAQGMYILSEHIVVFLSMSYPAAIFPCVLRHFRDGRSEPAI